MLADYPQSFSLNLCESLTKCVVNINIFQFFESSSLPLSYKSKLIRLLSLTVGTEKVIFSKSFMSIAQITLLKWQRRKLCVAVSTSII